MIPSLHPWLFLAMVAISTVALAQEPVQGSSADPKGGPKAHLVYIVGAVNKPGGYVMPQPGKTTFLQILALAGGVDVTVSPHSARIIRHAKDGSWLEIRVDLNKVISGKAPNIDLVDDDILFVLDPRKRMKPVGPRDLPSPFFHRAELCCPVMDLA